MEKNKGKYIYQEYCNEIKKDNLDIDVINKQAIIDICNTDDLYYITALMELYVKNNSDLKYLNLLINSIMEQGNVTSLRYLKLFLFKIKFDSLNVKKINVDIKDEVIKINKRIKNLKKSNI